MWQVRRVTETGSTNADMVTLAGEGAAEGTVVVADYQSAGRGRLDREWETPPGSSLTVSFLLRPDDVPTADWPWLPLLVGVVVVETVADLTGVEAGLKWPNDVLVGEAKLAGILVERVETPLGAAAVAGVGLNIRQNRDQLPDNATSLVLETTRTSAPSRDDLLDALCTRLSGRYEAWRSAGTDASGGSGIADEYRARCVTLGRRVRVELPGGRVSEGRARDIDGAGRLLIETDAGVEAFGAGDVVHLRPA
ncbi:biotin--[acetyl-CoA-carboxylase] ligase [Phytoactinopolyspora endophytica]|uniref:biotin--[acetyl-CoA-carboxylase] ligase n=1 Tax=Phytoactinopolyspora endophytica TaxID=1642495 RepID=UPI00101C6C95|nr:biotin--[acetyl-CoA-carboxylase] ligase [Phytoactinopolyspora endophytica]